MHCMDLLNLFHKILNVLRRSNIIDSKHRIVISLDPGNVRPKCDYLIISLAGSFPLAKNKIFILKIWYRIYFKLDHLIIFLCSPTP